MSSLKNSSLPRFLVTGATGFIGSHVVRALVTQGVLTTILVRERSSLWRLDDIKGKISILQADLAEVDQVVSAVEKAKATHVLHLGGGSLGKPWETDFGQIQASIDVNLRGTLNLLKALHQSPVTVKCFIRMGGLLEYGDGPQPFREIQREQPVSIYPALQVATTMVLNALKKNLDFPILTLRLASVYGPGRDLNFFVPSAIVHMLENKPFDMSSGEQRWDMLYIDDAVEAILLAARSNLATGEVINIGAGRSYRLKDIATLVARLINSETVINLNAISEGSGNLAHLECDISKATKLLAWQPKTEFEYGMKKTIAWYRDNYQKMRA